MTDEAVTRIWVVEDNELLRGSYETILNRAADLECCAAFGSCEDALAALDADDGGAAPDLVLMDLGLPGMDGVQGILEIQERAADVRVVVLTIHEDGDHVFDALCAGASGYLLKPSSASEILGAVRELHGGGVPMSPRIAQRVLAIFRRQRTPERDYNLTPREREVLAHVVDGLTRPAIAAELGISEHTVSNHLRHVYEKLHVRTRGGAVAKALRERIVPPRRRA